MTVSVWGPVQREMRELLQGHPDDVPAVVDQLVKVQDVLCRVRSPRPGNPLCEFNQRYLTITEVVLERLYAGRFADPAFLSRLTVEVAARYFDALRAFNESSPHCPRVWAGLFQRGSAPDHDLAPAVCAGINAHVTVDLPVALVTTFDHLGTDPIDDSDQHHDYLQIIDVFRAAVPGTGPDRLDRWQLLVDAMNGTLDDWGQGDPAGYARNIAWRNAQRLWAVRHDLTATDRQRARLDGIAADLGRLLLSPLGTFLR